MFCYSDQNISDVEASNHQLLIYSVMLIINALNVATARFMTVLKIDRPNMVTVSHIRV